jgi:hypothetical protein
MDREMDAKGRNNDSTDICINRLEFIQWLRVADSAGNSVSIGSKKDNAGLIPVKKQLSFGG